jgi:hypothetical protein
LDDGVSKDDGSSNNDGGGNNFGVEVGHNDGDGDKIGKSKSSPE